MPTRDDLENIDRIVDRCLTDKAQAARMKQALHRDLERKPVPKEIPEDDIDDLWDNLPV